MSILGYSSSYFLPEYWAATPLYGEKIIPLIDYILSTDYAETDKLATAFYNLENKYKNTANLPIDQIEAIIEESGYGYVRDLLGNDEDSIRLLTYLLVLIHQLKGSGAGINVVLNLLRKNQNIMVLSVIGNPSLSSSNDLSNITENDYVYYSGYTTDDEAFELKFQIRTGNNFSQEQCIASIGGKLLYLGINTEGQLVLSLGNNGTSWNIANRESTFVSLLPNTTYYIKLKFDGYEYIVYLSEDGKKYENVKTVESSTTIHANKSLLFIGIDGSSDIVSTPFKGSINLGGFTSDVENLAIQEWFDMDPLGEEDTFIIKAELDINLLNSEFFKNFSKFIKKYVYPSLAAFDAKLQLENNITFLPYSRQRMMYVALSEMLEYSQFMVKTQADESVWEDFFSLNSDGEDYDAFQSLDWVLVPVGPDGVLVLRGSNDGLWSLPDNAYANNSYLQHLLVTNTTSIEINNALKGAFSYCNYLSTVEFRDLETINAKNAFESTFGDCSRLEEVKFPKLRKVSGSYTMQSAFKNCTNLNTLNIPQLEIIEGDYALKGTFYFCGINSPINFLNLEKINGNYALQQAFNGCYRLTTVSFPKLKYLIGNNVFDRAFLSSGVINLSFPELTYIEGNYAMRELFQNSHIENLEFPKLESIIGNYVFGESFYRNSYIKSISFPELTSISGSYTFNSAFNYAGIRGVSFPKLEQAGTNPSFNFAGCNDLVSVDLGSLKKIETGTFTDASAFNGCSNLTYLNLSSVESIKGASILRNFLSGKTKITEMNLSSLETVEGNYAMSDCFYNCTRMTSVDLSSLKTISGSSVMNSAFSRCTLLTETDMSNLVSVSGNDSLNRVFSGCSSLVSMNLSSLKTVNGDQAMSDCFYDCTSLVSVDLSNLLSINGTNAFRNAFGNCSSLTSVDLSSLNSVSGSGVMSKCFYGSHLTNLAIPNLSAINNEYAMSQICDGNTYLISIDLSSLSSISGSNAMSQAFYGCTSLNLVDLSSLETIEGTNVLFAAFGNCSSLTSIDLGSLRSINENNSNYSNSLREAFRGCSSLTSVNLSSLSIIKGERALYRLFYECTSLATVTLPLSLTDGSYVLQNAFYRCTNLSSLSFPALTPSSFGMYNNQFNGMLSGCSNVTVHFPSNLQSIIGNWTDVQNGFGGTNTTILYDLPVPSEE